MKTKTLAAPLSKELYHGSRGLLYKNTVSDVFMEALQTALKGSEFDFEFTSRPNQEPEEKETEAETLWSTTLSPYEVQSCFFLKNFVEAILAYRKAQNDESSLSCLILLSDVMDITFEFYDCLEQLFGQEGVGLRYFVMKSSEYLKASEAHAYSASSDIIIECNNSHHFQVYDSSTYRLGRLNGSLLVNAQVIGYPSTRYSYDFGDYSEQSLGLSDVAGTMSAYMKNRDQVLQKRSSNWFYENWKSLLKDFVETHSYYHYYLYKTHPFVLEESLKSYDQDQAIEALGQIQDSHLPFITAALNAAQFGQVITFADSTREEHKDLTNPQGERQVVKPALAYESFGSDGEATFQL